MLWRKHVSFEGAQGKWTTQDELAAEGRKNRLDEVEEGQSFPSILGLAVCVMNLSCTNAASRVQTAPNGANALAAALQT